MEKFVRPVVLEQWNSSKRQYEEIKDMSLKFWKDDKLYFQLETMEEPSNYWSSGVAKAMAYSRYIIWWAEGFKPHVCFRGTFNSEEELSEFLIKFKEFVIPSSLGGGDNANESWELPSSTSSTSRQPTQQIDDLISFQEDHVDHAPCLSPGAVGNEQRGAGDFQEKPKSIFTITSRSKKRSLEQKRSNLNEVRQRKRSKTVNMPFGLHKRITKPSKSDNLLATIKSAFKFLLSDEEVNILILSKSSEPIRIRTTSNNLKWSLEGRSKFPAITEEAKFEEYNYAESISENTSYQDTCLKAVDRTLYSQKDNLDEMFSDATEERVPSRKLKVSSVATLAFCFLMIWFTWYLVF